MTTTSAPTRVEQLAEFVSRAEFDQLSEEAREQLKLRVLDSLGCALGALEGEPVKLIAEQNREFVGEPLSAQIDAGRTGARPRRSLQRRAGPLPGLQRLIPGARRDDVGCASGGSCRSPTSCLGTG